jgi:hypothetical protein
MTTYAWPNTVDFLPRTAEWRVVDPNQRSNDSPLSGYSQTVSMPGAKWGWSLDFGPHFDARREAIEAFLLRLSGRQHRVALWDLKRHRPRGTCNLSGVTLRTSGAQFVETLNLQGCGAGNTLLGGDWIGLANGQVVRIVADATANGAGEMTVEVRHMLRSNVAENSAVTLDRPSALYVRTDSGLSMPRQRSDMQPAFSVDFVETFA